MCFVIFFLCSGFYYNYFLQSDNFEINEPKIACPAKGIARLGNPSDCKSYIMCIEGSRINYHCTANLFYDVRSGRCTDKDKARCAK